MSFCFCLSLFLCLCLCLSPPHPRSVISQQGPSFAEIVFIPLTMAVPTVSIIINRTPYLLPSAPPSSLAFITISIGSILTVSNTILISIIGHAYTVFTINRPTVPIKNHSLATTVCDVFMNPLLERDKVWGFCPYRFIKMGNTSMAGGHMTVKQWTNTDMNISYTFFQWKVSVWGHVPECLGFTRLHCGPSPFNCTAVFFVSWF